MITGPDGRGFDCIVVDLNTQWDFCSPSGASPVANVDEFIPALRRTMAWVKRNCPPVISSIESCRRSEVGDNPRLACCIDGTGGQRKIEFTLFAPCTNVEVDNTLACPIDLFNRYRQLIFRKRTEDLLGNPKADRMFTQLAPKEFILFGVGIERAIKSLALGLLARNKRVTIVVDASGYWNRSTADLAIKQMIAKGARIITVNELRARKLDRFRRYMFSSRSGNGSGRNGRNGSIRNGEA